MGYGLPDIINGTRDVIVIFGSPDAGYDRRGRVLFGFPADGRGEITNGYFTRGAGIVNAFANGGINCSGLVHAAKQ